MNNTTRNRNYTISNHIAIFIGLWGGCFIVAAIAAAIVWMTLVGGSLIDMEQAITNPLHAGAIRIMQVVTTLFAFGLPPVLYAWVCFGNPWKAMQMKAPMRWTLVGLSVLIAIAIGPVSDLLGHINEAIPVSRHYRIWAEGLEASYESQVKAIINVSSFSQMLMSLVMLAFLPAVFEELMFRGGIQQLLQRWWRSPIAAILVTSFIFSAIHFSWFGFLPRFAIGVVLGLVLHYTRNLWYCVLIHFLNNGLFVLVLYIFKNKGQALDIKNIQLPWWTGVLGIITLVGCVYYMYKVARFKNDTVAASDTIPATSSES